MSWHQRARGKAPPQPLTCPPIFLPQCYKSSKDHSPQLDVNLLGCTVIHKEKQVRKKEHKLKIIPTNADVIVLGLQSKDQAEQWLRVSGAFGACPAGAPTLALLGDRILSQSCPCVLWLPSSLQARIQIHRFLFVSRDSSFPQLPDAFCTREAVEGPPSPAAAAGGTSGVGAQHELAEDGEIRPFP